LEFEDTGFNAGRARRGRRRTLIGSARRGRNSLNITLAGLRSGA